MKIIKKNQLTLLVLTLMLVTAGYLNYNSNVKNTTEIASLGDATLVSTDAISENANNTINNLEDKEDIITNLNLSDDNKGDKNEYFNSSKIDRDKMYSEMLESYNNILNSTTINDSQKDAAQREIDNINKTKNAIMISENLIKTKGFEDVIIFVNDNNINVIINKDELTKEDLAQIQSIIARELNVNLENIHIMTK